MNNNTEADFPLQNMFSQTTIPSVKPRPTVNFQLKLSYESAFWFIDYFVFSTIFVLTHVA